VRPHPFRPLDAVLGVTVVAVGILVAVFGFENLDEDNVFVWLAIGAGLVGLSLLPWPHRRSAEPEPQSPALPDESSPDG
jgi:hypothetical protein